MRWAAHVCGPARRLLSRSAPPAASQSRSSPSALRLAIAAAAGTQQTDTTRAACARATQRTCEPGPDLGTPRASARASSEAPGGRASGAAEGASSATQMRPAQPSARRPPPAASASGTPAAGSSTASARRAGAASPSSYHLPPGPSVARLARRHLLCRGRPKDARSTL